MDSELYNASKRLGEKSYNVYNPYFVFEHSQKLKHNNGVVKALTQGTSAKGV